MKKLIVQQVPMVLGVLLNNVLYRYGKAGVNYVEFSISADILSDTRTRKIITDEVFASNYPRMTAPDQSVTPRRRFATDSTGQARYGSSRTTFILPKVKSSQTLKPCWRKYLNDYHEKCANQTWVFLAGFNRGKPDTYRCDDFFCSKATATSNSSSSRVMKGVQELLELIRVRYRRDHPDSESIADENYSCSDKWLSQLAYQLIGDDVLSKMYKSEMANIDKFLTEYCKSSQSAQTARVSRTSPVSLRECVAGVD